MAKKQGQIDVSGVPAVGRAPEGQLVAETPATSPKRSTGYGWASQNWLGDPEVRYGRRRRGWHVPISTKLEMMNDPVIGLCFGFMASKLVNARYEILCADETKRRFFRAMYDRLHHQFILQAAPAILLGSLGMIKKFEFARPQPLEPDAPPVWTSETTPYVVTGFEQMQPGTAQPRWGKKGQFDGIDGGEWGHVDVFYSLWLTMGKERAFGAYGGHGRLNYVYSDWWLKQIARDFFVLHLQKSIDRVTKMRFPQGKTGGKDNREIALETGDDIRAGATAALPSDTYEVIDVSTGQTKPTTLYKWDADFMPAGENVGAFHEMDDHLDQKMSLGMFVPPQAFLNVRQSALGGPTTADVLGELAVDLLLMEAVGIDTHLNEYVFPIVDRLNFPPGSPPVEKRTTGLVDKDKQQIMEVVKTLAGHMDSAIPYIVDLKRALERLGIPVLDEGAAPPEALPARIARQMLALQAGGGQTIPQEILEQIAEEVLPDDADEAAVVTDEDLERVVRRLKDELPELFDREI